MKKLFIFMFFALSMNSHASITQKNLENFFKFISPAVQNVAIMKIDFTRPSPYRIEGTLNPLRNLRARMSRHKTQLELAELPFSKF